MSTWAPNSLVLDCDPVRIGQVLDNLVSNAVKYSPAGSAVFVVGTHLGDCAQVQVIDHGHGMPPEDAGKAFEKFYRSATSRMSTTPGLGIGLSLSKAIVDQHGGTLPCHTTLGEDTVFILTLPLASTGGRAPGRGKRSPWRRPP